MVVLAARSRCSTSPRSCPTSCRARRRCGAHPRGRRRADLSRASRRPSERWRAGLASCSRSANLIGTLLIASSVSVAALAAVARCGPTAAALRPGAVDRARLPPGRLARRPARGRSAIGSSNAARIGAGFVGPVLATTLLAWTIARRRLRPAGRDRPGLRPVRPGARGRSGGRERAAARRLPASRT